MQPFSYGCPSQVGSYADSQSIGRGAGQFGFAPIFGAPMVHQVVSQSGSVQQPEIWTVPSGCNQKQQVILPPKYNTIKLSGDLGKDSGRRTLMDIFAERNGKVWDTNRLKEFMPGDVKAQITNDGRVIVDLPKLKIPDMNTDYREDLKRQIDNLYRINCKDKENVQAWMKNAIGVCGFGFLVFTMIGFIWLVNKANNNDSFSWPIFGLIALFVLSIAGAIIYFIYKRSQD